MPTPGGPRKITFEASWANLLSLPPRLRNVFRFYTPTELNFARGKLKEAGALIKSTGINRPFIVTDDFLAKSDGFQEFLRVLEAAGLNPATWTQVQPDPPDTSIDQAAEEYRRTGCDGVIGYGGGSSMDTAKGVAIIAAMGGASIREFMPPDARPVTAVAPLVCIPTTSGTGSEVTQFAVVTDTRPNPHVKSGVVSPVLHPRMAIVDPAVTDRMPPKLTASTGMDAFAHAIEAYTSRLENPISDALSLYAIEIIGRHLPRAVYDGSDREARDAMSLAAVIAGISFDNGLVHFGHAIGHALGARYHIPHGTAVAMPIPAGMEFVRPAREEKLTKVAAAMGVKVDTFISPSEAAEAAIDAISRLKADSGIPTLAEATMASPEELRTVAEQAMKDGSTFFNPRPVSAEDYLHILEETMDEGQVGYH